MGGKNIQGTPIPLFVNVEPHIFIPLHPILEVIKKTFVHTSVFTLRELERDMVAS